MLARSGVPTIGGTVSSTSIMIEVPTLTMTTATPLPGSSRRRAPSRPFGREEDLYAPVKRFLEGLGYEAKGEVRGCDVLAVRPGGGADPPVVVELKLAFTLSFVLQGLDRLAVTDLVYLAVPAGPDRNAPTRRAALSPAHPGVRRLCRRLGLGLLAVHAAGSGPQEAWVEVVCDPGPPARRDLPRRNKARAALLLGEHAQRRGDPNRGGGAGGTPLLTAYRQEALRCATLLRQHGGGPLPVALLREGADAPNAVRILYRNVYGWFEPVGRGLYRITDEGVRGLETFAGDAAQADVPVL
jgi:hypothetical protein